MDNHKIERKSREHKALTELYGQELPEQLSFLASSTLSNILHCIQLYNGGMDTTLTPEQYTAQIDAILEDPLFSRVVARDRTREQWFNIKAFATTCQCAYQRGRDQADRDLKEVEEIDTTSHSFFLQAESVGDSALFDKAYHSADRDIFRKWLKRGYHSRAQELELAQEQEGE